MGQRLRWCPVRSWTAPDADRVPALPIHCSCGHPPMATAFPRTGSLRIARPAVSEIGDQPARAQRDTWHGFHLRWGVRVPRLHIGVTDPDSLSGARHNPDKHRASPHHKVSLKSVRPEAAPPRAPAHSH
eukprot:gene14777-biopygen6642